jgi:hypothetical protein
VATYSRRRNDDEAGEPVEGEAPPPDPRDDVDPLQLPEDEQLVYDLSGWPIDVHAEVAEAMAEAGIGHSWLGTDLVVHDRHEETVDALLAAIERRHGLDGETPVEREPGSEVEYDLTEWDNPARALLTARLIEADVPFRWEGGLLVAAATDEVRVDGVLDAVDDELVAGGGVPPGEEEPGESPLSALFVAVDDLAGHPNDRDAILRLNQLFEQSEAGPVPFGVSPSSWEQILDQVSDLLDLSLDAEDIADVKAEALEVREVLRPLV